MNRWSFFTLFVFLCACAYGQSAAMREEAHQLSVEGEKLMREGLYKEAVAKFTRAAKLDDKNKQFTIQLARAHFFNKNYNACMGLTKPLMSKRNATFEAFQLYGNCLDELGKDYEALATYREGLAHFPGSGVLYMEMGILEFSRQRDSSALVHWEDGIRAQPTFAPNYYFAAKSQFADGDYAWAFIYAETFINLERIGDRVREMSKLIFESCAKARSYDFDGVFHWRFSQTTSRSATPLHAALDDAFTSALPDTAWVPSIPSLAESRRFAAFYVPEKFPDNSAEELFRWLQVIAGQGHFEAYNYWLLYDASPDEFFTWYDVNKARYEAFESWFLRNPFQKYLRKPIVR